MKQPSHAQLLRQLDDLTRRLEEAEDTIRALQAGEADAIVVAAGQEQVLTLESPELSYRLLVDRLPHAAATVTSEGRILSLNPRFADLLRRAPRSILGQPFDSFVAPADRDRLRELFAHGCDAEVELEVDLVDAGGAAVSSYLGISPVREGPHAPCLMIADLTEQRHYRELKRAQEALRQSEERLDLAQRAGRVGTFEWNLRSGAESWSTTTEELHGLPPGSFGGRYEDWKRAVHPEDRERAVADRRRAIDTRGLLDSEFRIVRPDGEVRWIAARGEVFSASDGDPERLLGVNLDVTERKRIEQELRDADRKKDEFLATLAHELRNPLAPIRNAVQILQAKGPPTPELVWARGVLDRQAQLMARLLEDLLDVSRISRHRLELRIERIRLADVVDAALETSRPGIEAAGHELTVELPEEPVWLDGDPVRLAQVFANLLNNAAKYTEGGGRIRLVAGREGGDVVVRVEDSGIGIAAETLPHIFEIFSQVKPAVSQGGLGVGLSLVKGLVELHGGRIEARSEGPGRGSAFVVRLPAGHVEAATPALTDEPEIEPATDCRILIVDDNRDSADSLAMLLRHMGNEVETAYDGDEALARAETMRPDVLLLDIGMPTLNGYEACRRIRERPWGRGTFVLAMTGWGQEEDRRRTEEAGFDRHMVKPVDPTALLKLLATQFAGRRSPSPRG